MAQEKTDKKKKYNHSHGDHRIRMREKFRQTGFDGWSKYEVLEYMLFNVYRQGNTNDIAHNLLDYSGGSIVTLLNNARDFRLKENVSKAGDSTVMFLRSLKAFVDYYRRAEMEYDPITLTRHNFFDVVNIVGLRTDREEILMICLDFFMHIINVFNITDGSTPFHASTTAEKIMKSATISDAKKVVFIHNHPDGCLKPSNEDIVMTARLELMLMNVGISLVDHYIVSGRQAVSIKMELMKKENNDALDAALKKRKNKEE